MRLIFRISVLSSSGQLKILQLILKMISFRLFGRIGEVALVRYLFHIIEQLSKKMLPIRRLLNQNFTGITEIVDVVNLEALDARLYHEPR